MKKAFLKHIAIIGIYAVLTVILTWPVVAKMTTHIAGAGGDPWQTLWRMEEKTRAVNQAMREGTLAEYVKYEFGGGGEARLVNLSVWPWLPLTELAGNVAAYNIIWLLSFVLSGYGMYLLVRWLVKEYGAEETEKKEGNQIKWAPIMAEAPAFLAGLAYMTLPYHAAHAMGHFGAMQIQWLPLIILTGWSQIRAPKAWKAIILTGLVIMQAWTEHHYFLWVAIFSVWFVIYYRVEIKEHFRRSTGAWYAAVMAAVIAVVVGASISPTLKLAQEENSQLALGQEQVIRYSADPFAYVLPASFHTIWGKAASTIWGKYFTGNVEEATLFVGLLPLLVVIFFWQKIPPRQLRFWLATAGIFVVISLGPRLHLLGRVTGIPLPWALIDQWPIASAVRTMARAGIIVNLSWVVLFGWVLATQLKRVGSAVAVAALVIVEFMMWPTPVMPAELPLVYQVVKDRPGQAIIEIPTATNYTIASRALYGSLVHGKKVLNNIALERAEGSKTYDEIRSMPALRQILYLRTSHLKEKRDEFMAQNMVETLSDVSRWLQVGLVIVHPDSLSAGQREALVEFIEETCHLKREVVGDAWLYDLGQLPDGDGVFVARDDGWGEVNLDSETKQMVAGIQKKAGLTIYNFNDRPANIQFRWQIVPEDKDNLRIVGMPDNEIEWDETKNLQIIDMSVPTGRTDIQIENSGAETIIVRDPIMSVSK